MVNILSKWKGAAMQKDDNKPNDSAGGDCRREDIERLKKALREVADRLSNANEALKKAADMQGDRNERAAQAAEQLKKALEELRKRREVAMGEAGKTGLADTAHHEGAYDDNSGAAQHHPADSKDCPEDSLPVYRGDFTSADEYKRLTNMPPITDDEIRNIRWDLFWKFFD
jgi:ABC-type transporter Mla subunit MlaD